mmetsp:Transcript_57098/g.125407  ORF Transcript_57098/g.125407 Transcript_57098/m.125407 type:complete len:272 (+) Transcript_57098:658-1473(+)
MPRGTPHDLGRRRRRRSRILAVDRVWGRTGIFCPQTEDAVAGAHCDGVGIVAAAQAAEGCCAETLCAAHSTKALVQVQDHSAFNGDAHAPHRHLRGDRYEPITLGREGTLAHSRSVTPSVMAVLLQKPAIGVPDTYCLVKAAGNKARLVIRGPRGGVQAIHCCCVSAKRFLQCQREGVPDLQLAALEASDQPPPASSVADTRRLRTLHEGARAPRCVHTPAPRVVQHAQELRAARGQMVVLPSATSGMVNFRHGREGYAAPVRNFLCGRLY